MAMTWRQLINAALATTGDTQIPATNTTITDAYMLQVAEFSNQIYEEVWSACQWRALWTVYNIAYNQGVVTQQIVNSAIGQNNSTLGPAGTNGQMSINGTFTANITTTGQSISTDEGNIVAAINAIQPITGVTATFNGQTLALTAAGGTTIIVVYTGGAGVQPNVTGLNNGSYFMSSPNTNCSVVRMMNPLVGRPQALCFDTTSVGVPYILTETPLADLIYINTITQTLPVEFSTNFAVQDLGNDIVNLYVYPASSTPRNIRITLYNPPARWNPSLAGTTTGALDSPILIPYKPILMGTIWQILEERGEELGMNSQYTEAKYRAALDDAVSRDTGEAGGLIMLVD